MPRMPSETTIVRPGTRVRGDLTTEGDLRVDGNVEGTITLGGELHIGRTGRVDAEVVAARVVVEGELHGRVQATQQVAIAHTGKLVGVVRGLLTVEEGGIFQGRLEVDGTADRAATNPASAPPQPPEAGSSLRLRPPSARPRRLTTPSGGHPAISLPGPDLPIEVLDEPPPAAPTTARMKAVSDIDVLNATRAAPAGGSRPPRPAPASPSMPPRPAPTSPSMPARPAAPSRREPTAETPALTPRQSPLAASTSPASRPPPPPRLGASPQAELEDAWFEEPDFLVKKAGDGEPASPRPKPKNRPPKTRR